MGSNFGSAAKPRGKMNQKLDVWVSRALKFLESSKLPLSERLSTKNIISTIQILQIEDLRTSKPEFPLDKLPDVPLLYPSTLLRNTAAQKLIEQARGESASLPDFQNFGGWQSPQSFTKNAQRERRNKLESLSLKELAYEVVGLEEVISHAENRRRQLEILAGDSTNPWPSDKTYPLIPFEPSATALGRYEKYWKRSTKADLIQLIISLNRTAAEHEQQLLAWDANYALTQLVLLQPVPPQSQKKPKK
ncbi:hypothetical protein [Deinococcus sp. LM3]|uniref:hypothetical protein n=1 Tax=Deinococcus sp. LM3 TaxID=1938608 RepID=UPI00117DF0DB|nr:hypothetical protein [Deinococcus sp. LM3]